MEAGLDTGPMLATVRTPVDDKTTGELTEELAELGAALIVEVLHDLPGFAATPQDHALATYAAKIDKAEARIDWTRPAEEIERLARALAPFPGAWRSEEHTSELQSLMRTTYAVFCLKKKKNT